MRGPGGKAAADGNEAGSVKTAWVGAKGLRDGPGTEKGSELGWCEPGRTHSEQLGLTKKASKTGLVGLVRTGQGGVPNQGQDQAVRGQLGLAQGGKMTRTGQRPGPGPQN